MDFTSIRDVNRCRRTSYVALFDKSNKRVRIEDASKNSVVVDIDPKFRAAICGNVGMRYQLSSTKPTRRFTFLTHQDLVTPDSPPLIANQRKADADFITDQEFNDDCGRRHLLSVRPQYPVFNETMIVKAQRMDDRLLRITFLRLADKEESGRINVQYGLQSSGSLTRIHFWWSHNQGGSQIDVFDLGKFEHLYSFRMPFEDPVFLEDDSCLACSSYLCVRILDPKTRMITKFTAPDHKLGENGGFFMITGEYSPRKADRWHGKR